MVQTASPPRRVEEDNEDESKADAAYWGWKSDREEAQARSLA
jgi:hypothetical protein